MPCCMYSPARVAASLPPCLYCALLYIQRAVNHVVGADRKRTAAAVSTMAWLFASQHTYRWRRCCRRLRITVLSSLDRLTCHVFLPILLGVYITRAFIAPNVVDGRGHYRGARAAYRWRGGRHYAVQSPDAKATAGPLASPCLYLTA